MRQAILDWEKIVPACVLMLAAAVLVSVIAQESITADEVIHISAGVSYLQARDSRINPEHPPLTKLLAAFPFCLSGVRPDYRSAAWETAEELEFSRPFLEGLGFRGERLVFVARLPMALLVLTLSAAVFLMARNLSGTWGGLLSLIVFVASPFFLAYGPLILTDTPIALFGLLTVWSFVSLWESPSWRNCAWFAAAFFGALLSKFSAGLLIPVMVILAVWFAIRPASGSSRNLKAIKYSAAGFVMASAAVYVSYAVLFWRTDLLAFLTTRARHTTHPGQISLVLHIVTGHPWLEKIVSPVVLYGLGITTTLHTLSRPTYLLGHVYAKGTWLFFPMIFLEKMTEGFLCLLAIFCGLFLWRLLRKKAVEQTRSESHSLHVRALTVLLCIFAAAAVASPLNIGIRHLSVPIAALTVLLSLIVPWTSALSNYRVRVAVRGAATIAVIASCVATVAAYPDYIGYFNRLKGNRPSYEVAVGADLDWGQSLIELRKFQKAHQIKSAYADVKGSISELYLSDIHEFDCENGLPPDAEWVAVGASRFVLSRTFRIDADSKIPHCLELFQYPYWATRTGDLYVFQVKTRGQSKPQHMPSGAPD